MKRLAAAVALVALAACTGGDDTPRPTAAPSTTATSHAPTPSPQRGVLAFATKREVRVRDAAGVVKTLDFVREKEEVGDIAWTAGGTYLAWLHFGERTSVTVSDPANGRLGTWVAPATFTASGIGTAGEAFLLVGEVQDRRLAVLDPEEVIAGRGPRLVPLNGVPRPRLLTTGGGHVLLASEPATTRYGGPETVYEVRPDGASRKLFTDGEGQPEREVRDIRIDSAALTADGNRLAYTTGQRGEECELDLFVVVRDLAAGRELPVPSYSLGNDVFTATQSIVTGGDGRTYAAATTAVGGCSSADRSGLYLLEAKGWRRVGRDAVWGATNAAGALAVIARSGRLDVAGKHVADGVTVAAWSPAPA